ncbi:biotin biosynthesis protein BioY [Oceanicola sp. 22II-s10i]|uniref:biotin transporter BioY n=1 Tax=Oceanicola sp. 22II-s10i TaxID=1317116 RepID=UPI000B51FB3A|nr:biotin transporter BioY [Oceanicola sp. 22II-s10i]OWU83046.1 biotin biosynthesis protein BioY [Oceanicola sp. 22II-s10i]
MTTRDIVFIALFAAIMAALAVFPPVMLPLLGVPITAQSMGPMLAGGVLGARRGGLAMVLFLALVAIGLPLLSGGRGGFGVFFGPTAGYLIGWIVAAVAIGWMTERVWHRLNYLTACAICVAGGIGLLYAVGVPWSAAVANVPLSAALIGSAPFLPGDVVKALIAAAVIVTVRRSYPLIPRSAATSR